LRFVTVMGVTDAEVWARRRSSFGTAAAAYAEFRPDYPAQAVRWCLAPVGRDLGSLRVLDLGAGTGKLTAILTELGTEVTAVEPDPAMLAELRRGLPFVPARPGSAESIPLPDASVDAVLCGHAMHWFDMSRALPEIARVLAPGGILGALWNSDDDRVPWVAGLQEVWGEVAPPSLSRSRAADFGPAQFAPLFSPTERAEFANAQPLTADTYVELMGTHSLVLVMAPQERAATLDRIRAYLASRPETADGQFELPMVTAAIRSVILPWDDPRLAPAESNRG
jgi:SAM-dependent methyltransferase